MASTHHAIDYVEFTVRSAGGKIVREPFAFPGGRRFQVKDPSGNELGVWSHAPGH